MKKKSLFWSKSVVSLMLLCLVFIPAVVAAGEITDNMETVVGGTELAQGNNLYGTISNVIQILLGFLGVLMVIIVLWAGFTWMTAGGDSAKVGKAKSWLINAIIGIVIILAAYSISFFVIDQIQTNVIA